jgi:DNA-binding LytR/AlgR family response regulator
MEEKMLSIAVCDDEVRECCCLSRQLQKILEEFQIPCIIHSFGSGKELLRAKENFDIIFLDIIMGGVDGLETARLLREREYDHLLVFVSSSREYVFDSYEAEPFWYLLKPVEEQKLRGILKRIVLRTQMHPKEYILVSKDRQRKKLFLKDIYYFEIRGRVMDIHSSQGTIAYYERMGQLEKELREKDFFRCHKSYLVNLAYVSAYNRQELILDSGEKLIIAKRRYEEFCREILRYMRANGGIV